MKRVIGIAGDRVTAAGGELRVNGVREAGSYASGSGDVDFDVVVPEGTVWLMGDNRGKSRDSRAFLGAKGGGFVSLDNVEGKVVAIPWPPARTRTVGGL